MTLDPNDPRPAYRQIAGDLRQAIADGVLGTGERLPSTSELMDRYGVANQTVQNAFRQLRTEGLIVSFTGRGSFVVDDLDIERLKHDAGTSRPSPEYIALRDHLDRLSAEMTEIREQVEALAAKVEGGQRKRPAKQ